MLMQSIRIAGYVWDDQLPTNLKEIWNEVSSDLERLSEKRFERYINLEGNVKIHAFADASAKAYGAAVYVKTEKKVDFIFAKARVTPARTLTIPKLELLAATVAARAITFIHSVLRNTSITNSVLWSDSKCIIAQVRTTKILPTYVENRVREIRSVPNLKIKYVPSALNIADAASRGCKLDDLPGEWWTGPEFLNKEEACWPEQKEMEYEPEQVKEDSAVLAVINNEEPPPLFGLHIAKVSSLRRLLRIAVLVLRFCVQRSPRFGARFPEATTNPKSLALRWYLQREQQQHYSEVFTAMSQQKFHPLIKKFQLIEDDCGLLRCRGRFEFHPVPEHVKFPILLPLAKTSVLTRMIITQAHENNYHVGTNHTLAAIRRQYWIPTGRAAVYNVIHKCMRCQRYTVRPYQQPEEAPLPQFRLDPEQHIWANTGMDILGHIFVEEEKMWILIFTCLTTRAITLEPLESLSAEHVTLAFRAFIARRATPEMILSDQGAQFQPMIETLKHNIEAEIVWKPLPCKAPWMGAMYECLIAITKQAIQRTLHRSPMTKVMCRTILLEVENVINSRPITYVESDIGFEALTPNHFFKNFKNTR